MAHDRADEEVAELVARYWSLGAHTQDLDGGRVVSCPVAPEHPLGTYLMRVSANTSTQVDRLLADASAVLARPCERIFLSSATPAVVEAYLMLLDWVPELQLQLLFPSSTAVEAPTVPLRPIRDVDGDWSQIEALFRIDHLEEDARAGQRARSEADTHSAVLLRRRLVPAVEYFGVERAGTLVACVALWLTNGQAALIEDVFVRPEARGAGLATEMLRFAVAEARRRGAGPIVIGAEVDNTPKHLYARFGFQPIALVRSMVAPSRSGVQGTGSIPSDWLPPRRA